MKLSALLFLVLGLQLAVPAVSSAALRGAGGSQGGSGTEACCNPKPAEGDIVLPMPGGLSMVVRTVAVPAGGMLYDKHFVMGVATRDDLRSIYERRVDGYVAAQFRTENLPADWKKAVRPEERRGFVYYFLGKYEVSVAQWHAVMGGAPAQGEDPGRPKAGITWYEIQQFLEKYNTWLLANHADSLPSIDGMPAYLRLPSEEEWEFAGRGGNLPPEKLDFDDFPLEDGRKVEDYAVFGSSRTEPAAIGSRQPNCLGLHDMGGNVAELVNSMFRFTIADMSGHSVVRRMHGAQGGLVSKGGSFLSSSQEQVYPGRRTENRMFAEVKQGARSSWVPYSARNLGFRIAVSSLDVPGHRRSEELTNDAAAMAGASRKAAEPAPENAGGGRKGRDRLVQLDPNGDVLAELDKVAGAVSSPFAKSNLAQLRDMLEDRNAALQRSREASLSNDIRSALYKAESLRNMAFRCYYIADTYSDNERAMSSREKQDNLARMRENFKVLETATDFYRISVNDMAKLPPDMVSRHLDEIFSEYHGSDMLNKHMQQNAATVRTHIAAARKQGIDSLTVRRIWKDIIPEAHLGEILKYF